MILGNFSSSSFHPNECPGYALFLMSLNSVTSTASFMFFDITAIKCICSYAISPFRSESYVTEYWLKYWPCPPFFRLFFRIPISLCLASISLAPSSLSHQVHLQAMLSCAFNILLSVFSFPLIPPSSGLFVVCLDLDCFSLGLNENGQDE